jgi:hypothetical protein
MVKIDNREQNYFCPLRYFPHPKKASVEKSPLIFQAFTGVGIGYFD